MTATLKAEDEHFIDLNVYAWRKPHGDLEAIGTWFGPDKARALVLIWGRDYGKPFTEMSAPPCMVRERNIWIYDEHAGDPRMAAREMIAMAKVLGIDEGLYGLTKLLSIVRSHIGDLITMPPKPPADRTVVVAEMTRVDERGRTHEIEVTEDV